jgi:hypothetical protein
MDVIKITPTELRAVANELLRVESQENAKSWGRPAMARKFNRLADKLEADNLDALAFCAPAKGVQA